MTDTHCLDPNCPPAFVDATDEVCANQPSEGRPASESRRH